MTINERYIMLIAAIIVLAVVYIAFMALELNWEINHSEQWEADREARLQARADNRMQPTIN